jgi:hypothetical protein
MRNQFSTAPDIGECWKVLERKLMAVAKTIKEVLPHDLWITASPHASNASSYVVWVAYFLIVLCNDFDSTTIS